MDRLILKYMAFRKLLLSLKELDTKDLCGLGRYCCINYSRACGFLRIRYNLKNVLGSSLHRGIKYRTLILTALAWRVYYFTYFYFNKSKESRVEQAFGFGKIVLMLFTGFLHLHSYWNQKQIVQIINEFTKWKINFQGMTRDPVYSHYYPLITFPINCLISSPL